MQTITTWEKIESKRDHTFRRTPKRQVRSIEQALAFVNEVGFCFAFTSKNAPLPCLWHAACGERNPQYPKHTHHDPYVGLVWRAKDILPADKKVFYARVIKKIPSMISLEYMPCFYRLARSSQNPEDYLGDFMSGDLSPAAKKIMDALLERSPQITAELKLSSGMTHPSKRKDFDRGMADLQNKMYVTKIAEFYSPFTFLWELVDKQFETETTAAQKMTAGEARYEILKRYFRIALVSQTAILQRLFNWPQPVVTDTLDRLEQDGIIRSGFEIKNEKRPFYVDTLFGEQVTGREHEDKK